MNVYFDGVQKGRRIRVFDDIIRDTRSYCYTKKTNTKHGKNEEGISSFLATPASWTC